MLPASCRLAHKDDRTVASLVDVALVVEVLPKGAPCCPAGRIDAQRADRGARIEGESIPPTQMPEPGVFLPHPALAAARAVAWARTSGVARPSASTVVKSYFV